MPGLDEPKLLHFHFLVLRNTLPNQLKMNVYFHEEETASIARLQIRGMCLSFP